MSKMSEIAMTIEELRNAGAAITDTANYLAQQFSSEEADKQQISESVAKNQPKQELKLEDVRVILSVKSRAGYIANMRELLQKYSASKLSQMNLSNYEALLRDAEMIGNAT